MTAKKAPPKAKEPEQAPAVELTKYELAAQEAASTNTNNDQAAYLKRQRANQE